MSNLSFSPAIKQPSIVPYLIQGESAKEFIEEYNKLVDSDYNSNPNLKVLNLRDVKGVPTVVGSNSLVLPVVQRVVGSKYRVGRPEDLQRTLNDGDTLSIRGNHYIDLGLVLDFTGRNHNTALDLWNQIPQNLRNFEEMPSVITGYGLKNFAEGAYNLGFVFQDGTQLRGAPILSSKTGRFSDKDVSLETGLPTKLGSGDRTLYTASQDMASPNNLGLSRLCLDRDLSLGSLDDSLADSYGVGRVVLF